MMVWFLKAALFLAAVIPSESCGSGSSRPKRCTVSQWTDWSECSKSCDTGTRTRTRAVANGVYPCSIPLEEEEDCLIKHCPIDCVWAAWTSWSSCLSCGIGARTRFRKVKTPAYYEGKLCEGKDIEFGSFCSKGYCFPKAINCNPTQFACNNKIECVDKSLTCNQDFDCSDHSDESNCGEIVKPVCKTDYLPLNADDFSMGYDIRSGKSKANILDHTKYHGKCVSIPNVHSRGMIRVPNNLLLYHDITTATINAESYHSSLSIMELEETAIHNRQTSGFSFAISSFFSLGYQQRMNSYQQWKKFYEFKSCSKYKYFRAERVIQIGGFKVKQNDLDLSPQFQYELSLLPKTYNYYVYQNFVNNFGTHYYTEGTLGGKLVVVFKYRESDLEKCKLTDKEQKECIQTESGISWNADTNEVKKSHTKCSTDALSQKYNNRFSSAAIDSRSTAIGGSPDTIATITTDDINNNNTKKYETWANTLHEYPSVIDFKLAPISSLVKDPIIRINVDKGIQEALKKYDDSICSVLNCINDGKLLVTDEGKSCKCLCKRGYQGDDCSFREIPASIKP